MKPTLPESQRRLRSRLHHIRLVRQPVCGQPKQLPRLIRPPQRLLRLASSIINLTPTRARGKPLVRRIGKLAHLLPHQRDRPHPPEHHLVPLLELQVGSHDIGDELNPQDHAHDGPILIDKVARRKTFIEEGLRPDLSMAVLDEDMHGAKGVQVGLEGATRVSRADIGVAEILEAVGLVEAGLGRGGGQGVFCQKGGAHGGVDGARDGQALELFDLVEGVQDRGLDFSWQCRRPCATEEVMHGEVQIQTRVQARMAQVVVEPEGSKGGQIRQTDDHDAPRKLHPGPPRPGHIDVDVDVDGRKRRGVGAARDDGYVALVRDVVFGLRPEGRDADEGVGAGEDVARLAVELAVGPQDGGVEGVGGGQGIGGVRAADVRGGQELGEDAGADFEGEGEEGGGRGADRCGHLLVVVVVGVVWCGGREWEVGGNPDGEVCEIIYA